jgi:hypothetical protein
VQQQVDGVTRYATAAQILAAAGAAITGGSVDGASINQTTGNMVGGIFSGAPIINFAVNTLPPGNNMLLGPTTLKTNLTIPQGSQLTIFDPSQDFVTRINGQLQNQSLIGGSIDNAAIGQTSPGPGSFSTLSTPSASISGGSIDGTALGQNVSGLLAGVFSPGTSVATPPSLPSSAFVFGPTTLQSNLTLPVGATLYVLDVDDTISKIINIATNNVLVLSASSGQTIGVPNGYKYVIINSSTALTSLNLILPSVYPNNTSFDVIFNCQVNSLTVSAPSGFSLNSPINSNFISSGSRLSLVPSNTIWY